MTNTAKVLLYGYQYSVYSWVAHIVLLEKAIDFRWIEIDPFNSNSSEEFQQLNPFQRVPLLVHQDFSLYETSAIVRYIDEIGRGASLQPNAQDERARVAQILSIIDSYAYWPLVRQVFSHGYWRPSQGEAYDHEELEQGLSAAPKILSAIEEISSNSIYLINDQLSLADLYCAPFLTYFSLASEGEAILNRFPKLVDWLDNIATHPSYIRSKPDLPTR